MQYCGYRKACDDTRAIVCWVHYICELCGPSMWQLRVSRCAADVRSRPAGHLHPWNMLAPDFAVYIYGHRVRLPPRQAELLTALHLINDLCLGSYLSIVTALNLQADCDLPAADENPSEIAHRKYRLALSRFLSLIVAAIAALLLPVIKLAVRFWQSLTPAVAAIGTKHTCLHPPLCGCHIR